MSKAMVDELAASDAQGASLYEEIVETWESVVAENTNEIGLVTDSQARDWLSFKENFTARIIRLGEQSVANGVWDVDELAKLRRTLKGATYVPGADLRNRLVADKAVATQDSPDQARKTQGLIGKLKGMLSR
jgi:hypothetical protein